jgi:Fuc2NAc and GlcNAc transferase
LTVTALTALIVLVASALLTRAMCTKALSGGVLDVPNARSSHRVPTPRGGGVAIVAASTVAYAVFVKLGVLSRDLGVALLGGGLAVATVGFLDDRRSVPPAVRLVIHIGAALWALWWLGGFSSLQIGSTVVTLGAAGCVLGVLGIVWVLNLFNFMDGIDGIAGSEAIFIAVAAALLNVHGGSPEVLTAGLLFGAACAGFLVWNWPPAKIFMGDVGSGYSGYVLGVLGLAASRHHPAAIWVWLILGGVFFVDATITLIHRLARGEALHQAHRIHAYQWLARRWGSHQRVTISILAVNLFWLLPCAVFASAKPTQAAWVALLALTPLVALAVAAGAGRRETP